MTEGVDPTPWKGDEPPGWSGRVAATALSAWYLVTCAPGLLWFDTGEIALVSTQLGLGHPPGFVLYTVVAGWLANLPGVDPLWMLNALSAICAGLCALPADALLRRAANLSPWTRCLLLLAVGVLSPLWDQGTRIEVYAPATLLSLTLLAAGAKAVDEARADGRTWLRLGVLAGLLACINPVFAVAAALGVGLTAAPSLYRQRRLSTGTAWAACGGLVGLLPHLHLLYVRGRVDRFVWGDLADGAGVWAYLSGKDYGHSRADAGGAFGEHLSAWLGWLTLEGALAVVVLGVAGWLVGRWTRRRLLIWGVPAMVGGLFTFSYGTYYPQIPDYNGYLGPALWLSAVGLGVLAARLPAKGAMGLAAGLLLVGGAVGERPVWARSRASVSFPHTLARAHLDGAPEGAILIARSDHLVFPIMYLQEVEGVRRDVVFINAGFAASSWYWDHLYARHPSLTQIPLAAPNTGVRLRRLVRAEPGRPVRVEDVTLAGALGIRPCPSTFGFALGPECAQVRDDPAIFAALLAKGWAEGGRDDHITRRVIAALGYARAQGLFALGDVSGALAALRDSLPPEEGWEMPVPHGLRAEPGAALPSAPVLLGTAANNRAAAAWMLRQRHPTEAATWLGGRTGEDRLRSTEGSAK